jgi:hypothetical protein
MIVKRSFVLKYENRPFEADGFVFIMHMNNLTLTSPFVKGEWAKRRWELPPFRKVGITRGLFVYIC